MGEAICGVPGTYPLCPPLHLQPQTVGTILRSNCRYAQGLVAGRLHILILRRRALLDFLSCSDDKLAPWVLGGHSVLERQRRGLISPRASSLVWSASFRTKDLVKKKKKEK